VCPPPGLQNYLWVGMALALLPSNSDLHCPHKDPPSRLTLYEYHLLPVCLLTSLPRKPSALYPKRRDMCTMFLHLLDLNPKHPQQHGFCSRGLSLKYPTYIAVMWTPPPSSLTNIQRPYAVSCVLLPLPQGQLNLKAPQNS
jgi:hypothetical protein